MSLENILNNLIKAGKLKKQTTGMDYLDGLLVAAKRNFEAATLLKNRVDEAAFKLVYDGLLQIGRVVLLINGYRPDDGEQHKTTFLVAGELLGREYGNLIARIQKFRIKRNDCVYEPKFLVSGTEAEAIFEISRMFWRKVRVYLEEKNPHLKLFKDF